MATLATNPHRLFAQPKRMSVRECLEQITPEKKWGINVPKNTAWLELMSREEAEAIIAYFKAHHYHDIALMYKRGTEIPVVSLRSLDTDGLNRIAHLPRLSRLSENDTPQLSYLGPPIIASSSYQLS